MERIVFDCERMKYANTGLFSYCHQLGRHLQHTAYGLQNALAFYTPPPAKGIFGNLSRYITQHSIQKFFLPSLKGYTIWHATYQSSQYLPFLNKKIKVVLTIHDLNFLYDNHKSEEKKQKYLRHLQKNIDRSSAIVCVSEFGKRDVLKHCDTGNKPVYVIHNGTNSLEAPTLLGSSYKPLNRFLFSIGVVNRKKNFHVLLPLLQHNSDMELLIAGRRDDEEYIHFINNRAHELGVAEKVHVLGAISEQEKSWYFQNCYAFTFPSLAEGFGLPVAEAMSVGKPLFLSDKTALPEIGRDVAFYFEDFNGIKMQTVFVKGMQQYSNGDMEERIRKRSGEFCWHKAAQQYAEVYGSI
jgi:glycosyltransferase involved in cell wall biosynthesis